MLIIFCIKPTKAHNNVLSICKQADKQLICVFQDLFAAGWSRHDERFDWVGRPSFDSLPGKIQANIQVELDHVCCHCKPTLAHRSIM